MIDFDKEFFSKIRNNLSTHSGILIGLYAAWASFYLSFAKGVSAYSANVLLGAYFLMIVFLALNMGVLILDDKYADFKVSIILLSYLFLFIVVVFSSLVAFPFNEINLIIITFGLIPAVGFWYLIFRKIKKWK